MKSLKRLVYLGYYLKKLDKQQYFKFLDHVASTQNISKSSLQYDVLLSVFRYNISLLEYFQFTFYQKSHRERQAWAGTGFMYEFQRIMNPPKERMVLDDKTIFYKKYSKYFVHHVYDLPALKANPKLAENLFKLPRIVLKESRGKCGLGTAFVKSEEYTAARLVEYMGETGYDLAETFIEQHPDLQRLSPSGVNTVRIFTQLNRSNEVGILGCRQRISVNSPVDNLAAGNLAAPIDEETGIISGPGVYSDITKAPEMVHPVTGIQIKGFRVPFWKECLQLAKDAALEHPDNRSVGWDIVVTQRGPGLIEGNHDWCKLVWQLPVQKGLKAELLKYV